MSTTTRDYIVRSEECNVMAGMYKMIVDEKRKLLKKISEKYDIPYEELILKYCRESVRFPDAHVSKVF